jgi:hypothetical protein
MLSLTKIVDELRVLNSYAGDVRWNNLMGEAFEKFVKGINNSIVPLLKNFKDSK